MKVLMIPHLNDLRGEESGIARVIEAYFKYLPEYGVELVPPKSGSYDLKVVHAGTSPDCDVAHTHGLYWTADYDSAPWEWRANETVVSAIRCAREVTVPSAWVAEAFKRDMRFSPHVIPHGIDWHDWQHERESKGFALWNKNRVGDVCDPRPVLELARRFLDHKFVTTFALPGATRNVETVGMLAHPEMKGMIQEAGVYLSTTKETFGIGTLEAMASGVPVLGFAHGGNLDLVGHGVNGYLAQPGDYEDLAEGFDYCLRHRAILGANGREIAKRWAWQYAIEKVREVYDLALEVEPPTVAVVIPSYNYADKVGRAIESAQRQDFQGLTQIIVVDDGSEDGGRTRRIVEDLAKNDSRIEYIRQENQGVAVARNNGIARAKTKYISCLDADDMIEPEFLTACVNALEEDRSLGIAYTRLRAIKPDGASAVSPWPGPFDYDKQLARQNQVPTCCVFRREMWKRLGGYKRRYAPKGAGSEDAEFWLRAGAYGYGAKLATDAPLFVYSFLSGTVTGDPHYKEVDWTAWQPWVKDQQHPFASVATARRQSHPVRQYDEPLVSVIIPVGPGHGDHVEQALDSLEAQTLRQWEVIVVNDTGEKLPAWLYDAYPYPLWLRTLNGGHGPGFARNHGAYRARGAFLLFLDVDDWLLPLALQKMIEAWEDEAAIIYSDYVGIAQVSDPSKLAPDLQRSIHALRSDGEAFIGYKAANYDCNQAQRQPELPKPYLWANVTALIPKLWHDDIGGFDDSLKSWEDVDYHWRLARRGRCYVRIPEELMVYRLTTGDRRRFGLQAYGSLVEYLRTKYKEIETVGCQCGGGRKSRRAASPRFPVRANPNPNNPSRKGFDMADEDFVMARYLHPSRGQHRVVGPRTRTDYGYRKGGDVFLVHRLDVQTQPHLFQAVAVRTAPKPEPVATPPPEAIAAAQPVEAEVIEEAAEVVDVEIVPEVPALDLQRLPGVTKDIAEQLEADGLETVDDLLALGSEGLQKYRGIGAVKAETIIAALEALKRLAAEDVGE